MKLATLRQLECGVLPPLRFEPTLPEARLSLASPGG